MGKDWRRRLEDWPRFWTLGPPGVGKTHFANRLGSNIGYPVVHNDDEIVKDCDKKTLEEVKKSLKGDFTKKEGEVAIKTIKHLSRPTIVDFGGSIIYCPEAMDELNKSGIFLYLTAPDEWIIERIKKRPDRGLEMNGCDSYEELLAQRRPLYEEWRNFTVPIINGDRNAVADLFAERLRSLRLVPRLKH